MLELSPSTILPVSSNPLIAPVAGNRGANIIEQELNRKPHLHQNRRHARADHKADLRDARQAKTAAEAIQTLPEADESVHVIISGRFALWDMVPAVMSLAGADVEALHIATLGFSKRNVAKMAELVDAGRIGTVKLLCSHYFAGTSSEIYACAVDEFAKRQEKMQFLSIRTHAKLMAIALADGRRVTIESSANLRSCKNIEQATLFGDPDLYAFHRDWIDELFEATKGE